MTDLYDKFFDTLLVLRDVRDRFQTYSASDIKALITSKMKAIKKEPKALEHLYLLEKMITELRETLITAKDEYNELNRTVE